MAKRGLIVLVLVWSVLLLAPMFRAQSSRMRAPLSETKPWPYSPLFTEKQLAQLTREHPENATLALAQFQSQREVVDDKYWRQFDALINRFSDNSSVRSAKLIKATSGGLMRRTFEPLLPNTSGIDKQAEEYYRKWQNPSQRVILVEQARVGARQAPENGFFPWIEAMVLLNRDDEPALRALQNAARCTQFDDSLMANQRALILWREQQGPLAWDEKLASCYAVLLPHYAKLRELAREVTWSGIEHYRRGDKAGAYRRWRAISEASGAFRRAQSHGPQASLIGLFVAEAMERLVWGNVADELNPPAKVKNSGTPVEDADAAKSAVRLRAFVELARRDGQNEIANYAIREDANFEGRRLGRESINSLDKLGFESSIVRASLELPWLGRLIFWLSVAGALGLLVCLVWRFRVGGARWFGASGAQIAFFSSLWLGVLALAFWGRTASQMQQFGGYNDDATPLSAPSLLYSFFDTSGIIWVYVAATLALSVVLCYRQNARETERLQRQVLPQNKAATASAWLPKLSAFAWISVATSTIYWFAVADGTNAPFAFTVWLACALLALGLMFWRVERNKTEIKRVPDWRWSGLFAA